MKGSGFITNGPGTIFLKKLDPNQDSEARNAALCKNKNVKLYISFIYVLKVFLLMRNS